MLLFASGVVVQVNAQVVVHRATSAPRVDGSCEDWEPTKLTPFSKGDDVREQSFRYGVRVVGNAVYICAEIKDTHVVRSRDALILAVKHERRNGWLSLGANRTVKWVWPNGRVALLRSVHVARSVLKNVEGLEGGWSVEARIPLSTLGLSRQSLDQGGIAAGVWVMDYEREIHGGPVVVCAARVIACGTLDLVRERINLL